MKSGAPGQMTVYVLYVNGIAISEEQGTMSEIYSGVAAPAVDLKMNDLVQLYARRDGTADCFVRNFRFGLTKFVNNDP